MPQKIILLSGSVSSGKTTLAKALAERFGAVHVKTWEIIRRVYPEVTMDRRALQRRGESLDRRTQGGWVAQALARDLSPSDSLVVVDSTRIRKQIVAVRRAFGPSVVHVHLEAPESELARRYARRSSKLIQELGSYEQVQQNRTERAVRKLDKIADVVVDTDRCTSGDVLTRVAAHLRLYGEESALVDVLVGGQYGSEGKGHVAAYLAREYDFLVRVGGPNAGHTVYREPEPYIFHHLPSGTFTNDKARLVLAPGAVIYPPRLLKEIADHSVVSERLFVDPQAMIIQEKDRKAERQLVNLVGSTGQGVGSATARRILERGQGVRLARDVPEFKPFLRPTLEVLERAYADQSRILLEGTQGTGLRLHQAPAQIKQQAPVEGVAGASSPRPPATMGLR